MIVSKTPHTFAILFIFIIVSLTHALGQEMDFKHLTVDDGLSSNRIRSVFRDSRDYLWVCTDYGLNRYDGSKIETYYHNPEDSTSLTNNYVLCSFEDKNGNLWFGTNFGLNLYNRQTNTFIRFYNDSLKQNSLTDNNVRDILQDKNGTIWVATMNGFNKYLPESNDFKRYFFPTKNNRLLNNFILDLCYDSDSTLWFGTKGNLLWSFKIDTEKFQIYDHPFISATLNMDKHLALIGHEMWIGSSGSGLLVYNIQSGHCKKIPVAVDGHGTSGNDILCVNLVENKFLLIGVDQGGLNRLNLQTMKMEYFRNDDANHKSLTNNGVWCTYVDVEGIVYVGTSAGGLNIFNPKEGQFTKYEHNVQNKNSLVYNNIFKILEDSEGLIWLGTDGGGLSVFNPKTKAFKNYVHDANDPESISGNAILCIGEDKNQNIWFGTWGAGLNKFERKTEKITRFYPKADDPASLSALNVWDLVFDENGQMWISYLLKGVDVFDINKGVVERYRNEPDKPSTLMSNQVTKIIKLNNEIGFICNTGFCTWQPETKSFKKWSSLEMNDLNNICPDSKGNMWICTNDHSLLKIDPNGKTEKFDKNVGLPNRITTVLEDTNGEYWVTSNEGVSKYNMGQNKLTNNYLSNIDQNKNFAVICALKASDGTFYLGGYSGLYVFNPDQLTQNEFIPRVVIDDFLLFNKPVTINTPNSPLKQVIEETSEIILDYNEAYFSFGFSALNYTYPQKTRYAYKLEGHDNDWIYTTSEQKYANYSKPNPGTYTFMVKATNNDGVWNEEPATIKVVIVPPFWQRWWFQSLLVIFITSLILSFYFWRVTSLKEQHRVLEKAVWDRTTELRHTNETLGKSREEVLIKNMAIEKQNVELEIANQTKTKLFSIIAHDLKNPFNTILGFVNVLIENYDELSEAEKRNFLSIIQGSSQTAFALIENLLDWARTQTNKISLHFKNVNVKEMISANVQLVKTFGENKDVRIVFDDIDSTHFIYVDRDMMDTVIRNLLTNAIKFSKKGASIFISSIKRGDSVEISIKDQGIGMTEEQIEKLFLVGENQSTQGTLGETGTGLGVIICKEFVERNKGKIKVTSVVNEGTTFIITLPSIAL
ncbi:MAG: two-component regulator propeller domain-containing protein [Prolixibacteraceae bacterium]